MAQFALLVVGVFSTFLLFIFVDKCLRSCEEEIDGEGGLIAIMMDGVYGPTEELTNLHGRCYLVVVLGPVSYTHLTLPTKA